MKILYLNPGADMGGAETSLIDLLAGIRQAQPGWHLHLLSGADGPLLDLARQIGVTAESVDLPGRLASAGDSALAGGGSNRWSALARLGPAAWETHRYGMRLRKAAERLKPDLIHATGMKMQILAALYLVPVAPVLWHIHDYVGWRPLALRILALLAGRCRGALANSDSVAEDLRRSCPRLPWVQRVYNAVDGDSLCAGEAEDLDHAAGVAAPPAGTIRLGLVATYARWKGHLTFLDALASLPLDVPWRAYIVGGAIYRTAGSQFSAEELRREIDRRNLNDRVFLTGFLKRRGAVMRALDIVVHASTKPEPFGMVVIEAMACGRPVVVSAGGGALELFEEGVTGLGHPPGDAAALAHCLQHLLGDPDLRSRLSENGRSYALEQFSRRGLAAQLESAYRRCLEGKEL